MKRYLYFLLVLCSFAMSVSCGNSTDRLQQQVDSLQNALANSKGNYNQLNEYLVIISQGLDSIALQEQGLLTRSLESPLPNREEMKLGLKQLKETLAQQRQRINQLEQDVINGKGEAKKLKGLIAALKQQIEEKDARISDLLVQLENSNLSVAQLTSQVNELTSKTVQQEQVIQQQENTMQSQDEALNEAYIRIGTKKELKDAGLLSGGFLKKTKVDYSQVEQGLFQKVDIRQVTEIPIPSRKPKILTPVPQSSYTLQQDGQSTTLVIDNPQQFWSVSKFLIIQIK